MTCLIICECGDRLRAKSAGEVVRAMQRHLDLSHPEIAGAPLPGDLLAMVEVEE